MTDWYVVSRFGEELSGPFNSSGEAQRFINDHSDPEFDGAKVTNGPPVMSFAQEPVSIQPIFGGGSFGGTGASGSFGETETFKPLAPGTGAQIIDQSPTQKIFDIARGFLDLPNPASPGTGLITKGIGFTTDVIEEQTGLVPGGFSPTQTRTRQTIDKTQEILELIDAQNALSQAQGLVKPAAPPSFDFGGIFGNIGEDIQKAGSTAVLLIAGVAAIMLIKK